MTQRLMLDYLILDLRKRILGSQQNIKNYSVVECKVILDALTSYRAAKDNAPALNVEIDGVRFVPVDSLAKDEGK